MDAFAGADDSVLVLRDEVRITTGLIKAVSIAIKAEGSAESVSEKPRLAKLNTAHEQRNASCHIACT